MTSTQHKPTKRATTKRAAKRDEHTKDSAAKRDEHIKDSAVNLRDSAANLKDWAVKHKAALICIAIPLFIVISLFEPTKNWYVARRTAQDLAVIQEQVSSQTQVYTNDISRLQSKEGIEDEARKRGYVSPGETSVNVDNLPQDTTLQDPKLTYEDNRDWLCKALDQLFGYDPQTLYQKE